jgi:hypothetical protein
VDDLDLHPDETTQRSNEESLAAGYGREVTEATPESCWMCGAPANVFRFECPECVRRSEDTECRELRERLFPVSVPVSLPE